MSHHTVGPSAAPPLAAQRRSFQAAPEAKNQNSDRHLHGPFGGSDFWDWGVTMHVDEIDDQIRNAAMRLWAFHCQSDPLQAADVIIGLGSYDLRVAEKCAALYTEGWAPKVLFSGASGNWTEALYGASEAEVFADRAVACGLPRAALMLETKARNIGENMQFSAEMLPKAQRAILVTKPQTQLRCRATSVVQWPAITALVTAPDTSFDDQPLPHHGLRALVCEMVGDLERVRQYPALGFQARVEIPTDVHDAFNTLWAAGFVDHMP